MTLTDPSWVRPFWVERQADPRSADFVPGPAHGDPVNVTHRSWTTLGTLAGPERATVDPRGLVSASIDRWSLDWWIGAEDDWHVPGRNEIVRQRLLGDAPVVETAMRVPGGDALQRAYGYNSTELGPCVVIELENRTAVPFAVALAVRPYDVLGRGTVSSIDLVDATVLVNDAVGIVLPRPPAHTVASTAAAGDAATTLFANAATAGWDGLVEDPSGRATAAFVFPLAHTAVLRVVLPLAVVPAAAGSRRAPSRFRPRTAPSTPVPFPESLPAAEQVAKGWEAQTRRGLLVTVPDDRLQRAIEVTRNQLLLSQGGGEIVAPGTDLDFATIARVVVALDDWGFDDEAAQVLRRWNEMQALDGTFVVDGGPADRRDANGAALAALGHHWSLTRDGPLVEDLIGPAAKAVHRIDRDRSSRRAERDPHAVGLLPVGRGPAAAGRGTGAHLRDNAIAIVGLRSFADAAAGSGQPGVADEARRVASELAAALERLVAHLSAREGGALPVTPDRRLDEGVSANLDLVEPVGSLAAGHPAIAATLERIREQWVVDGAVVRGPGPAGLDPAGTATLARAELRVGDPRCWDHLAWLIDHASPTGAWPSVIHPRTQGGAEGAPHDIEANARFLSTVRDLLVHDVVDPATGQATGLALLSVIPPSWLGQPVDVRDAPTPFGTLSYSVRWHGERPALLWEVLRHDDAAPCTITAPGLDARWHTTEPRGEALLDAVPVPAEIRAERDGRPIPEPTTAEAPAAPLSLLGPGESPVAIDLRRGKAPSAGWTAEEPPSLPADGPDAGGSGAEGPGASFQ